MNHPQISMASGGGRYVLTATFENLADMHAAQAALASPPAGEDLRERVAAIIDPEAFAPPSSSNLLARELGRIGKQKQSALRKADAILSALPAPEQSGGRT